MDTAWIIGNMLGENANFIINILEPESINNIIAMLVEYGGGTSLKTIFNIINPILKAIFNSINPILETIFDIEL